jgi:hypothetical protein
MVSSKQQNYTNDIKKIKAKNEAPKVKKKERENTVIVIIECTVKKIKRFVSKCYGKNRFRSCPLISNVLTRDLKFYPDAVKKKPSFFVKSETVMVLTVNTTVL